MPRGKELSQLEIRQETSESFSQRFGQIFEGKINGLLGKNIPEFSKNGISPREKNLHRATLTLRIMGSIVTELVRSGRGELTGFIGELQEELAREHGEIYDSLSDAKGNLPPEVKKRVDSVRDIEI